VVTGLALAKAEKPDLLIADILMILKQSVWSRDVRGLPHSARHCLGDDSA
jgi:hypothetical protein